MYATMIAMPDTQSMPIRCGFATAGTLLLMATVGVVEMHEAPAQDLSTVNTTMTLCQQACVLLCRSNGRDRFGSFSACPCVKFCESMAVSGVHDGCAKQPHSDTRGDFPRLTPVCNSKGQVFPVLFVLGIQKGGTTTLVADLKATIPSILLPSAAPNSSDDEPRWKGGGHKEVHFFDHRERFAQGAALYSSFFPSCSAVRTMIPIDGTPDYFGSQGLPMIVGEKHMWEPGDPEPWERAAEFFGSEIDSKDHHKLTFIIIVRNPVDRYISAFNHICKRNHRGGPYCAGLLESVKLSVNDPHCQLNSSARNLGSCESIMLKYGLYWVALTGWVNRFPQSRFIVTTFSHYTREKQPVLDKIAESVGVVPKLLAEDKQIPRNVGTNKQLTAGDVPEATMLLNEYYEWHSHFLWKLLSHFCSDTKLRLSFIGTIGEF